MAADPKWDPKSDCFARMEEAMYNPDGTLCKPNPETSKMLTVGSVGIVEEWLGTLSESQLSRPVDKIGETVYVLAMRTRADREHHVKSLSQA